MAQHLGWFAASVQVAHMLSRQFEPESERELITRSGEEWFIFQPEGAEKITELY